MKLYFSIYFETTFITCTLPNSKPIYTQYQNNINGQGQRQISRSSDWIRLSNPFCLGQEIAEYLMLFIPMYYCYLTYLSILICFSPGKKETSKQRGGYKILCEHIVSILFNGHFITVEFWLYRLCIPHVEWMRWPREDYY